MTEKNNQINYLEMPSKDLASSKAFFSQVFGWEFVDYGPDYSCFTHAGMAGGFYTAATHFETSLGSPLIVIYHNDLLLVLRRVTQAGGVISKPIFDFPGGQRFHFTEPCGNEYAVWSE